MLGNGKIVFILLILLLGAAIYDANQYRIPNCLIVVGLITGVLSRICCEGLSGLGNGILGMLVVAILFYPLFLIRAFGAGDVKLLIMVGVWYGTRVGVVVAAAIMIAGILAVLKLVISQNFRKRMLHLWSYGKSFLVQVQSGTLPVYENRGPEQSAAVPFAVAVWLSVVLHEGGCF